MARKRHNPEQIVAILREAERTQDKKEIYRKYGISEQTYYRWKKMYGGMEVSEVKRIKKLEEENRKLKQIIGEQTMVIQAQKEVLDERGYL